MYVCMYVLEGFHDPCSWAQINLPRRPSDLLQSPQVGVQLIMERRSYSPERHIFSCADSPSSWLRWSLPVLMIKCIRLVRGADWSSHSVSVSPPRCSALCFLNFSQPPTKWSLVSSARLQCLHLESSTRPILLRWSRKRVWPVITWVTALKAVLLRVEQFNPVSLYGSHKNCFVVAQCVPFCQSYVCIFWMTPLIACFISKCETAMDGWGPRNCMLQASRAKQKHVLIQRVSIWNQCNEETFPLYKGIQ